MTKQYGLMLVPLVASQNLFWRHHARRPQDWKTWAGADLEVSLRTSFHSIWRLHSSCQRNEVINGPSKCDTLKSERTQRASYPQSCNRGNYNLTVTNSYNWTEDLINRRESMTGTLNVTNNLQLARPQNLEENLLLLPHPHTNGTL